MVSFLASSPDRSKCPGLSEAKSGIAFLGGLVIRSVGKRLRGRDPR